MTIEATPHTNNRKRASLEEQINRLDRTLDGLSENLNDAVADAVKAAVTGAVKDAVQTILTEVLTNPELIARMHASSNPPGGEVPPPQKPGVWARLSDCCTAVRNCLANAYDACKAHGQSLRSYAGKLWKCTIDQITKLSG